MHSKSLRPKINLDAAGAHARMAEHENLFLIFDLFTFSNPFIQDHLFGARRQSDFILKGPHFLLELETGGWVEVGRVGGWGESAAEPSTDLPRFFLL